MKEITLFLVKYQAALMQSFNMSVTAAVAVEYQRLISPAGTWGPGANNVAEGIENAMAACNLTRHHDLSRDQLQSIAHAGRLDFASPYSSSMEL